MVIITSFVGITIKVVIIIDVVVIIIRSKAQVSGDEEGGLRHNEAGVCLSGFEDHDKLWSEYSMEPKQPRRWPKQPQPQVIDGSVPWLGGLPPTGSQPCSATGGPMP